MMRILPLVPLCVLLGGCVPSPGGVAAVAITGNPTLMDPTGISGDVMNVAQMAGAAPAGGLSLGSVAGGKPSFNLAQMGARLDEVAAGRVPAAGGLGGAEAAGVASTTGMFAAARGAVAANAAVSGVAAAARADVLGVAGTAVDTSMKMGRLAESEAAFHAGMARHQARQASAAAQGSGLVAREDRPAEAEALLSIADGGSTASWKNPATGASGTVTLRAPHKGMGDGTCRAGTRSYRAGGAARSGSVLICSEGGVWYELG